jgi:hypothetical protein
MTKAFENDRLFKEAIGGFMIASSELEFALAILCSITFEDPRFKDKYFVEVFGKSLDQKRQILGNFIKENLPELRKDWLDINQKIGEINEDRRHLAHGFTQYYLPGDFIETVIKKKDTLVPKKFSIAQINDLTNQIHLINTGKNGISGVFQTKLFVARINLWNVRADSTKQMIYKVNNITLTD